MYQRRAQRQGLLLRLHPRRVWCPAKRPSAAQRLSSRQTKRRHPPRQALPRQGRGLVRLPPARPRTRRVLMRWARQQQECLWPLPCHPRRWLLPRLPLRCPVPWWLRPYPCWVLSPLPCCRPRRRCWGRRRLLHPRWFPLPIRRARPSQPVPARPRPRVHPRRRLLLRAPVKVGRG